MAQPLAWFEATGLPEQAFSVGKLIRTYRQVQTEIHAGQIFPIGKEPDGSEWTGFQSILTPEDGFLLVFREANPEQMKSVSTWLTEGDRIELKFMAGSGKSYTTNVEQNGKVKFNLPERNSFALYRYSRIKKH